MKKIRFPAMVLLVAIAGACSSPPQPQDPSLKALVAAGLFDGENWIRGGVLLIREGKVEAVGRASELDLPAGLEPLSLAGKFIVPGLINSHGHVGSTRGLQMGAEFYTREQVEADLETYAHYGVTTVLSLGGGQAVGFLVRDEQANQAPGRARLFLSGPVLAPNTPEEARKMVQAAVDQGVDFVKIRVDDNLGRTSKMPPAVYGAVIEEAHRLGAKVAAHIFYLEDAKALLRAGVDFLAHSIRDQDIDDELIALLRETGVCVSPTLAREVSTFVYEQTPEFFEDPFFLTRADPQVLSQLTAEDYQQQIRQSSSAQQYKQALLQAQRNLKLLVEAGIPIAFGTDSGPPARFQGFFEHLEIDLMREAGLTIEQILTSATARAANCLGLQESLGRMAPGRWADFVVLGRDPRQTGTLRHIESVWVAGKELAR